MEFLMPVSYTHLEEEFTRKNDKLDKQIEKETLAIAQMETEQMCIRDSLQTLRSL